MSKNLIGKKFGEYTVLGSSVVYTPAGNPRTLLEVQCSCGTKYTRERGNIVNAKHPMCRACRGTDGDGKDGYKHPLYRTYQGIKSRCYLKTSPAYPYYGARGITVCDRWRDPKTGFKAFVEDMGSRPSKRHSVDRKDNEGPYSPENCRWATPEEQYVNSRRPDPTLVTIGRHTKSVFAWCRLLGVNDNLVYRRMSQGQTP